VAELIGQFLRFSQTGHRRRDVGCGHVFILCCIVVVDVVDRTLYFAVLSLSRELIGH
jgi:hypothetical protein